MKKTKMQFVLGFSETQVNNYIASKKESDILYVSAMNPSQLRSQSSNELVLLKGWTYNSQNRVNLALIQEKADRYIAGLIKIEDSECTL